MDKIDKKKKDVKDIITKGEKLTEMAKAPVKPPHRAPSVSLLLPGLPQGEAGGDEEPVGQDPQRLQGEAGRPQGDVWEEDGWSSPPQSNAMNWNNFAEKCQTLQTQVTSTLLYTTAPCTPRSPRPRNRSTTSRRSESWPSSLYTHSTNCTHSTPCTHPTLCTPPPLSTRPTRCTHPTPYNLPSLCTPPPPCIPPHPYTQPTL